jgi:hypothetical protein
VSIAPRQIGESLSFASLTTAELTRQQVVWSHKGAALSGEAAYVFRLLGVDVARTAGTGNITVKLRFYDVSSSGTVLFSTTVALAASGEGSRVLAPAPDGSPNRWDIYTEQGLWVSAEASTGSGHTVTVTPILAARTAA